MRGGAPKLPIEKLGAKLPNAKMEMGEEGRVPGNRNRVHQGLRFTKVRNVMQSVRGKAVESWTAVEI